MGKSEGRVLLLVVLTAALAGGCLPVPTPKKVLYGTPVKPAVMEFLRPSITTKPEVLERLGQPTILWRDENIFVYRWEMKEGEICWMGGCSNLTSEHAFLIKFDSSDRYLISELVPILHRKSFGQLLLDWRDSLRTSAREGIGTAP